MIQWNVNKQRFLHLHFVKFEIAIHSLCNIYYPTWWLSSIIKDVIINARRVISRRHHGWSVGRSCVSMAGSNLSPRSSEGRAAARKPSSSSSSSRHVFGTVTTTQSTAFTVSTTSTHAQVSATVTSVTTSDASNSGEVRVSFLFYSASGSFGSACLLFSRLVFGWLAFSLSAGIFLCTRVRVY